MPAPDQIRLVIEEGQSEVSSSWGLLSDIEVSPRLDSLGPLPIGSTTIRAAAEELLLEAALVAKPKAAWKLAHVERISDKTGTVRIGNIVFKSTLLSKNLNGLGRVFPFLATEGGELAAWAESLPLKKKTAGFLVRYAVLKEAERRTEDFLTANFGLKTIGAMCPGVLPDWPLTGQKQLFELLSPLPEALGVALKLPAMWMSPDMSSSGLYFETEAQFHNCRLCPLDRCSMRRFEREG
ncbi:MAG: hypothetical protein LBT47_14160 [Deltaproteobacteria bacterium]|jgi:hypothetical protein|nr:hypothetical protein [Deltaproteobacteria bacterium]